MILILNYTEFNYCNITEWHQVGYTGKGVKVALVENDINTDHAKMVLEVLKQVAPDCEVEILKPNLFGVWEYPRFQIVSKSLASQNAPKSVAEEELKATNTLLVSASGNDGEKYMSAYARQDHWIGVGAVHLINGNPVRPSYSSVGDELEIVGFSNLMLANGRRVQGTSFATPFISGMLALYYQMHKDKLDNYPSPDKARRFLSRYTEDLHTEGHDIYTGNGLFILPKVKEVLPLIVKTDFPDLRGHWAEAEIKEALELGLVQMQGLDEKTWAPDAPLTRAQYAVLKLREYKAGGV